MTVIGLTGGICSGKSSVAEMIKKSGLKVIDADKIANEVLNSNEVICELVKVLGVNVCLDSGLINKKYLRDIVFNDISKKTILEKIIHPKVQSKIIEILQAASAEDIIFVEVPLLFEANWEDMFNKIWVVSINAKNQKERLAKRDKIPIDLQDKIISSQFSDEYKCSKASLIIDNNSSFKKLESKVNAALAELV